MCNAAPLVSFTFDDVPDSAYLNGAAILGEYDVHGTFYIASGTCGVVDTYWRVISHDQIRALHAAGHEIGCHTFSHVGVEWLSETDLARECQRNAAHMRQLCPGIEMTNFCYPFGTVSLLRKLQLQKRFDTCRGIYEGVNSGTVDLGLLRVIELYDRTLTKDKLQRVLGEARDRNGWVIFYAHDVADPPSFIGCSPRLLRAVIETICAEGISCLPIREALPVIGYPNRKIELTIDSERE
jgi:peptidoglycan/xylan/chitin deacetylase (PgdA/CDA1 family)